MLSAGNLSVYSRLEPKPMDPSLLDCEELLCASLAKVVYTPFTEDSHVQQSSLSPQHVSSLLSFIVTGENILHLSRGREFQRWCFL